MLTDSKELQISDTIDKYWTDLCQKDTPGSQNDTGFVGWLKSICRENVPLDKDIQKAGKYKVICVSGSNLEWIFQNRRKKFIEVCAACSAVLCCRITPKMKGEVVQACHAILACRSLSIGDGANDVPMIQDRDSILLI